MEDRAIRPDNSRPLNSIKCLFQKLNEPCSVGNRQVRSNVATIFRDWINFHCVSSPLIDKRLAQIKGVLDDPYIVRLACFLLQDNLYDVETKMNPGIAQQPQVIECGLAQIALFFPLDGFTRRTELFRLAGLDLNEHQPVFVAGNDIDLGFSTVEVLQKNLVTVPA